MSRTGTHSLAITIVTNNSDDWADVWGRLARIAADFDSQFPHLSVSSVLVDEEESREVMKERERNLAHAVANALHEGGYATHQIDDIIDRIHKARVDFTWAIPH